MVVSKSCRSDFLQWLLLSVVSGEPSANRKHFISIGQPELNEVRYGIIQFIPNSFFFSWSLSKFTLVPDKKTIESWHKWIIALAIQVKLELILNLFRRYRHSQLMRATSTISYTPFRSPPLMVIHYEDLPCLVASSTSQRSVFR